MTIFRVEHNKNYTTINNSICTDQRLSWKAKGIWMYAFSKPNDWQFNLIDLLNNSTDGRDAVRAGLKELEKFGYLKRTQEKNETGQFLEADWTFFETSQVNLIKSTPETDFPAPANWAPGNRPLLNTDILSTESNTVCVSVLSRKREIKQKNYQEEAKEEQLVVRSHKSPYLIAAPVEKIARDLLQKGCSIHEIKESIEILNATDPKINTSIQEYLFGIIKKKRKEIRYDNKPRNHRKSHSVPREDQYSTGSFVMLPGRKDNKTGYIDV